MSIKIDAHQHFWNYNAQRDQWITDEMSFLKRNFLPEDLKPILDDQHIGGCIAVQADESEQENSFLLTLSEKNKWIKGIVGWLDFTSKEMYISLEGYKEVSMIKGFRYILQGHPKRDLMLSDIFMKNISLLEKYDYTYDLLIFPDQLEYAAELVAHFPNQKFVLDHLGKPDLRNDDFSLWKNGLEKLAKHENVFCKLSGMVTETDYLDWNNANYAYVLDVATQSFGYNRLMFGSDWPVCQLVTSYDEVKQIVDNYFESFSIEIKDKIFGENTEYFYNI